MKHTLHLKAPKNWINDPNGFIYFKGMYHLFYQHFPFAPVWGTMHWGHAVSKDLVTWEHKNVAIFPTKHEDRNGCFSGTSIEHDGKMHVFYTGVHYEIIDPDNTHHPLNEKFISAQLSICSEDGYKFDNFNGKKVLIPVIEDAKLGDRTHTRDPKVWRGEDAWYMILGSSTVEEGGKVLFYRSEDLENWTFVNQASLNNKLGWMWECPDYFKVGDQDLLIFSPMQVLKDGKQYDSFSICMKVEFDEKTCEMKLSEDYQLLDCGIDLYAPQTTLDAEGRRMVIAWMRMPETVDGEWNGMLCMPRLIEVKNGHIYYRLHPELKKQFVKQIETPAQADEAGYQISMELQEGEAINVGGFAITRKNGKICTNRAAVYRFEGCEAYRMESETPEVKEGTHLDIYVDKNLIEIYINDGEYVLSNVVYGISDLIESDAAYKLWTI